MVGFVGDCEAEVSLFGLHAVIHRDDTSFDDERTRIVSLAEAVGSNVEAATVSGEPVPEARVIEVHYELS